MFGTFAAGIFSPKILWQAQIYLPPATRRVVLDTSKLPSSLPPPMPIYAVRNGPTIALPDHKPDGSPEDALTLGQRAYAIMVNQSEVSALAAIRLEQPMGKYYVITADGYDRPDWDIAGSASPHPNVCTKQNGPMFDPKFMECLRGFGATKADRARAGSSPWMEVR